MANYVLKGFGKISRIINNPIRRYPNLDVDGSKMPLRFVFLGEFGTELILWLPYLKFLKSHTSFPFKTVGRPGSSLFYSFSDEHYEVDSSLLGDSWGTFTAYYAVKKMFPQDTIVCFTPGEVWPNPRQICVDGYELTNHNSHDVISLKNWEKLSFDFIEPNNPFGNKPFVVINNKVFRQWGMTKPVNTFSVADLVAIRDFLHSFGYSVVYNHFIEKNNHDVHSEINDQEIFLGENCLDLRSEYENLGQTERNQRQISLYKGSRFVIAPQGGNVYLPAACQSDIYMLMRAGDYIDYTELARIFEIKLEVFYETKHLLNWLRHILIDGVNIRST